MLWLWLITPLRRKHEYNFGFLNNWLISSQWCLVVRNVDGSSTTLDAMRTSHKGPEGLYMVFIRYDGNKGTCWYPAVFRYEVYISEIARTPQHVYPFRSCCLLLTHMMKSFHSEETSAHRSCHPLWKFVWIFPMWLPPSSTTTTTTTSVHSLIAFTQI